VSLIPIDVFITNVLTNFRICIIPKDVSLNKISGFHIRLRYYCEISGSHGGEYEDDLSAGMLRRVVWYKLVDVSDAFIDSIFMAIFPSSLCYGCFCFRNSHSRHVVCCQERQNVSGS
jgi:hypothetical protein